MESIKNSCCRSVAPGLNEKSDDLFVFLTGGVGWGGGVVYRQWKGQRETTRTSHCISTNSQKYRNKHTRTH